MQHNEDENDAEEFRYTDYCAIEVRVRVFPVCLATLCLVRNARMFELCPTPSVLTTVSLASTAAAAIIILSRRYHSCVPLRHSPVMKFVP